MFDPFGTVNGWALGRFLPSLGGRDSFWSDRFPDRDETGAHGRSRDDTHGMFLLISGLFQFIGSIWVALPGPAPGYGHC